MKLLNKIIKAILPNDVVSEIIKEDQIARMGALVNLDDFKKKREVNLSKRDKKLVELMESALTGRGGAILVKADTEDGFEALKVSSPDEARKVIEKIKTGELELA